MKQNITSEFLKKAQQLTNTKQNKIIMFSTTKNGIDNTSTNNEVINKINETFNIELPNSKISNQKNSGRCWLFATLNMLKYNICYNLNINPLNFEFSYDNLTFYDKLERTNTIYEYIINEDKIDKRYLIKEEIINISDGGEFEYAKELILKYGLTPKIGYDSYEADNTIRINSLLKEKVIQDVDNLIKLKKDHTKDELRLQKEKYLIENYDFLTKVLNPPITNFNYTYYDKENNYKQLENITPKDFFNKYCTLNLNDYICLGSNNTKPYYKQYRKINCGNIYLLSRPIYLNLPIEEIKPIVIKSLKDKKAVFFACEIAKDFDKNLCLLDTELFNYKDIYNINSLTKYQGLEYNVYTSSHAMTFVGVNTKITPLLWKVENSWGEETNKKYLTMSDNYFDKYVYKVIIDKKYLTTKQKQYLQSPIINILPTDTI